jgi:hypothetical protein
MQINAWVRANRYPENPNIEEKPVSGDNPGSKKDPCYSEDDSDSEEDPPILIEILENEELVSNATSNTKIASECSTNENLENGKLVSNVTSNEKIVSDHLSVLVSHVASRELVNNVTSDEQIAGDCLTNGKLEDKVFRGSKRTQKRLQ